MSLLIEEIIRGRAPLRVSFAGGGTDVSPYCEERGGMVLSSTIDKYAYCTLQPRIDGMAKVVSLDYNSSGSWETSQGMLRYDGNFDFIKAVVNYFGIEDGFTALLHSDAPPGSGLGGSSTMMVAILGAIMNWQREAKTDYELAELAYKLEREELKFEGGRQDQYAAVFGGFNLMEFEKQTIVTPLRLKEDLISEMNYRSLLVYTGGTRDSGKIISEQKKSYENKDKVVISSMDVTKMLAKDMTRLLMRGELTRFGEVLNEAWQHKKNLNPKISNERIEKIYLTAIDNGAVGGKISGAGGGGYMYFMCDELRKFEVMKELAKLDAQCIPFNFESSGVKSWRTGKVV